VRRCLLPLLLLPVLLTLMAAPSSAGNGLAGPGWRWPVPPRGVVQGFAPPPQPWLAGQRGVDLAAPAGSAVRAAGAGVVTFAGRVAGVWVIAIRHPDGLSTTYEPVRPSVHAGDAVAAGQVIGVLRRFGGQCRPQACLHWGLRRGQVYLDPLLLLRGGVVRLLPYDGPGGDGPVVLAPVALGAALGALGLRRRRRSRTAQSAFGHPASRYAL
jgi:murein DD-endopeptidase MepM/ murein hydrolase activator NlpD